MERSQFAGLLILDSDESILEDGGSFIGPDRKVIDFFLERGAKTHRHTGASGLANPAIAADAEIIPSAGTIPADLQLELGFTLQDDRRGETTLSPTASLSTPDPLEDPSTAPVATADYTTGSLPVDSYHYGITWVDAEGGETGIGPDTTVNRAPGYPNAQIQLSGLNSGMVTAGAAGWRLYRARAGGDFAYLASGTGGTYTDDGTVSPICDLQPPENEFENSTNGISSLLVTLPSAEDLGGASFINVYVAEEGEFTGNVFLGQYPAASAGQSVLFTSLSTTDRQPPAVSTSVGDPPQIDPDTELLDWHWKRPVAASGDLGAGDQDDIRLVRGEGRLYGVLGASAGAPEDWTALPSGNIGGGGTGSLGAVEDEEGTIVLDPTTIRFSASGGAIVDVTDGGGGVADVMIAASGIQGPQGASGAPGTDGADGRTILNGAGAPDPGLGADGDFYIDTAAEEIYGPKTGGSWGTGTPLVGPQGPAGPATVDIGGSGAAPLVLGRSYVEFAASGLASLAVEDLGGGSARVLIAASGDGGGGGGGAPVSFERGWASANISLASGASGNVDFAASAAGVRLMKISTSKPARVRMYSDQESRTADLARPASADPGIDVGLLLDYMNPAAGDRRLTPGVDAFNLDDPAQNVQYLNIQNFDASGDVVVAFLYIPTEVV